MLLTIAAVCISAGACSGEEGESMPEVPVNPDALCTIMPHSIEISQVDASTTPITRSATGEPEPKVTYAENLGHNYSAEATLEAVPQEAQTRAAANLTPGAQYRIVVFDSSGAIAGNVVYKQGSTAVVSGKELNLKAGTYRLFAYTFNSTSAIRGLDADNKNVTVNNGEDFMTYTYASYTVMSTDYGSVKQLNISFVRQCARLTVTVIVEGYDDNTITAASLAVGNVFGSGSKWDGYANTDAATLSFVAGKASLTKATGNASSVDCGSTSDNPYLITSPCSNQTISVSGLSVTITGVGTKSLPEFNFPKAVTLAKGGSYKLTINTGNYYVLTRTNPVTIGGVKWARTNLQQTGSGNSAPVSFVDNPWDYGSYWSWGIRDATQYGEYVYLTGNVRWNVSTPGDANQDPCSSLGSGWRLPTRDEFYSLVNNPAPSGTKVRINGTINAINSGWAPETKGAVFISDNQVLFLPPAGGRFSGGNMDGYQGGSGFYWAETPSSASNSFYLDFTDVAVNIANCGRPLGQSLRCVQ